MPPPHLQQLKRLGEKSFLAFINFTFVFILLAFTSAVSFGATDISTLKTAYSLNIMEKTK